MKLPILQWKQNQNAICHLWSSFKKPKNKLKRRITTCALEYTRSNLYVETARKVYDIWESSKVDVNRDLMEISQFSEFQGKSSLKFSKSPAVVSTYKEVADSLDSSG